MSTLLDTRQTPHLVAGAVGQLLLLALLSLGVGLGPVGWVAGIGFSIVVWTMLAVGLRRSLASKLGPADGVTQARAVLVGGVAALVVDGLVTGAAPSVVDHSAVDGAGAGTAGIPVAPLVFIASVALVLDWVDGQVARRTGTATPLGARFDMEVDAFLILVLSVYLAGFFGAWVLAIGALRYLFAAAAAVLPWLRAALPPSYRRKAVAAVQGITLVVGVSELLPSPLTAISLLLALALLLWSFGRDTWWLWQNERMWREEQARAVPALPRSAATAAR